MSRINFVREIKQKNKTNINERKREYGWNDRFYLGKISDYKPQTINSNFDEFKQTKNKLKSKSNRGNTSASALGSTSAHNRVTPSKATLSIANDESTQSELNKRLLVLWDDLGVRHPYRNIFESIAKQLSGHIQLEYYENEINALSKFADCLIKYSKEISNREKAIFLLQKLDQVLGKSLSDGTNVINEGIIKDIIQTIRNLRVFSINVVNMMNKIREMCSYSTISGKYDLDQLNSKYMFNRNYLIKMRFDLDFLAQTNLSIFFNFSESSDPFLHAVSHEDVVGSGKVAIPMGDDLSHSIQSCQYIMMQDIIFYQMQGDNEAYSHNEVSNNSIKGVSNGGGKGSSERVVIESKVRDYNRNEEGRIVFGSKDDIGKRMEEYDALQRNLEIDRELIGLRKENLNKERELDEKYEQEIMKEDNKDKDKEMTKETIIVKQLSKKNSRKGKDKEVINDKSKEKTIERNTKLEIDLDKHQKEKDKGKDKDKEKDIDKDKNNTDEDAVNINWNNIEENELKEKSEAKKPIEPNINTNANAKLAIQSPKKTLNPQVDIPQTPHRFESPIQSPHNSILNNSMRRSLTPKSHAKQLQSSFKLSYYTGDLEDFIPYYNKYYSQIPSEQRIIFNIKSNPIDSITSSFNPKVIICTNTNNKYDIKGLCVLSFIDISSDNNETSSLPKVNIIHLSSIKQNEEAILSTMIEYIKSTIYCSQIDIDLYYQFEDNKFTINKELRDLFKNTLGFRWSRLENLAQHIRYQKMYLKTILEYPILDNYSLVIAKPLINIRHYSVLSINSQSNANTIEDGIDSSMGYAKYMNAFSIIYILNWMNNQSDCTYAIGDNKALKYNWDIKPKDNEAFINCAIGDYDKHNAILNDNGLNYPLPKTANKDNKNPILEYISAFIYLRQCFSSNITSVINSVYYNRLQGQIKQLKHIETNQRYYLIPTVDGSNSIIIAEMNQMTKEALIANSGNIYQLFNSFYNKIEPIEEGNEMTGALWIPSFDINTHLMTTCIEGFEGLDCISGLKKNGEDVNIARVDEYINVGFDYDANGNASFSIKEKKDEDIVIKDSFLFGVINLNVLSSFEFSVVLLLNVTKEHWKIRKNK